MYFTGTVDPSYGTGAGLHSVQCKRRSFSAVMYVTIPHIESIATYALSVESNHYDKATIEIAFEDRA